jgi:membrane protein DedA with SNARE-associated domain
VLEFAVNLIDSIGLLGASLLIAIEVIILPIPSELILLLTGFNVSIQNFGFIAALIATTTGSLVGALFLYYLGSAFSEERLENLVSKYGKYVGLYVKDLQRTASWFERHGASLVFFGRLIPLIRSLVSIPAGLTKMKLSKFIIFTTLGSGIWNSIWISLGFFLGDKWSSAEKYAKYLDYLVYFGVAIASVYFGRKILIGIINYRKNQSIN